jgi:hypothetical protein
MSTWDPGLGNLFMDSTSDPTHVDSRRPLLLRDAIPYKKNQFFRPWAWSGDSHTRASTCSLWFVEVGPVTSRAHLDKQHTAYGDFVMSMKKLIKNVAHVRRMCVTAAYVTGSSRTFVLRNEVKLRYPKQRDLEIYVSPFKLYVCLRNFALYFHSSAECIVSSHIFLSCVFPFSISLFLSSILSFYLSFIVSFLSSDLLYL